MINCISAFDRLTFQNEITIERTYWFFLFIYFFLSLFVGMWVQLRSPARQRWVLSPKNTLFPLSDAFTEASPCAVWKARITSRTREVLWHKYKFEKKKKDLDCSTNTSLASVKCTVVLISPLLCELARKVKQKKENTHTGFFPVAVWPWQYIWEILWHSQKKICHFLLTACLTLPVVHNGFPYSKWLIYTVSTQYLHSGTL